jgi:hypothetical protein
MTAPDRRRALLLAGLGFPQVREPPPEVAPMRRQGYDVGLISYEQGWPGLVPQSR